MTQNVAILGASDNPERYSNRAFLLLRECGHTVFPVSPKLTELNGVQCYPSLEALQKTGTNIDTLTIYVGESISTKLLGSIKALKPKRVIFNPGAENPALSEALSQAGIESVEACTLVLLRTNQF